MLSNWHSHADVGHPGQICDHTDDHNGSAVSPDNAHNSDRSTQPRTERVRGVVVVVVVAIVVIVIVAVVVVDLTHY